MQNNPARVNDRTEATRDPIDRTEATRNRTEATRRDGASSVSASRSQSVAPATGERVPNPEIGTPYLPEQASTNASQRWRAIQAEFVDDPRRSVADAHALVGELMERIVANFSEQRDALERQWSTGDEASTEDLRVCLQHYRAFFGRLLPAMPEQER